MEASRSPGAAAPIPAAVALPKYILEGHRAEYSLRLYAKRPDLGEADPNSPTVCLATDGGATSFCKWLTAAEARLLAVYLVDCANAVDNPAQRVIVEEGEGIGHE